MELDFFDKVFLINLDHRTDRLEASDCLLKEAGIEYERVSAVKDENGIKGLIYTMVNLFKRCIDAGYENVMVLEDDFKPLLPMKPFLKYVLPQLPKDYDCFFLGCNLIAPPKRISENILKIEKSYATHAVCYSLSGMKFIMPFLLRDEIVPYDILLMNHVQTNQKSYATIPMLCTQRTDYSDIENKEMDWGSLMAMTFTMHTKNLQSMSTETAFCNNGHLIDWQTPKIDPLLFEVQHPEFIGKPCDCGRFLYSEDLCGCAIKEWRIEWKENPNH